MYKPEVIKYLHKVRKIREKMERDEAVRECCECGDKMHWTLYMLPPSHKSRENNLKKFGFELLLEIWKNPIFVLKCCWCYAGVDNPHVIIDVENQANWRSL